MSLKGATRGTACRMRQSSDSTGPGPKRRRLRTDPTLIPRSSVCSRPSKHFRDTPWKGGMHFAEYIDLTHEPMAVVRWCDRSIFQMASLSSWGLAARVGPVKVSASSARQSNSASQRALPAARSQGPRLPDALVSERHACVATSATLRSAFAMSFVLLDAVRCHTRSARLFFRRLHLTARVRVIDRSDAWCDPRAVLASSSAQHPAVQVGWPIRSPKQTNTPPHTRNRSVDNAWFRLSQDHPSLTQQWKMARWIRRCD